MIICGIYQSDLRQFLIKSGFLQFEISKGIKCVSTVSRRKSLCSCGSGRVYRCKLLQRRQLPCNVDICQCPIFIGWAANKILFRKWIHQVSLTWNYWDNIIAKRCWITAKIFIFVFSNAYFEVENEFVIRWIAKRITRDPAEWHRFLPKFLN